MDMYINYWKFYLKYRGEKNKIKCCFWEFDKFVSFNFYRFCIV